MELIASAPGRAGIVGNPSDIYGGNVLSCSIPVRARCRLVLGEEEALPDDLRLWNAATARYPLPGLVGVEWSTDVPRSAGLSGSTALLAATLACVLSARGDAPDLTAVEGRSAFAELVRDVERYEADIVCGYQDAYMIVHGGMQLMRFAGKHPLEPGPHATLEAIDAPTPFLLITTGVERLSGSVHGPMAQRWLAGETLVVDSMKRLSELGLAGADALRQGRLEILAEAMTENHRLIAALGGSGEAIDHLIDRCLHHGARAAKLAGAGMGGTVIALTEDAHTLESKLRQEGFSRFITPSPGPGTRIEKGI